MNKREGKLGGSDIEVRNLQTTIRDLHIAVDTLIASPRYIGSDKVGFNGQAARKEIFSQLLCTCDFQFIVETGTWTGDTTGYLAEASKLPVLSVEVNRGCHLIAKLRLAQFDNVKLENSDSRQFMRELAAHSPLTNACSFFYLDAHWYDDLPLQEEIELIAQNWDQFVIMIDDFKVPGDEGYGYDDYGEGKTLSIEDLESSLNHYDLIPFFPSRPSGEETGAKRGCVVLAKRGVLTKKLEGIPCLKEYDQTDFFLKKVNGVVHIGANHGHERDLYAAHDLNVLWIEPIPEVFSSLTERIAPFPKQRALSRLMTDVDDKEYAFHISNNEGMSSSIVEFALHTELWPDVSFTRTVMLQSVTLSSLVERERIDLSKYDALVMDTQGSELLILKGAVDILPSFRFLKTEVADFESYQNCCRLSDMDDFLQRHGFRRVATHRFAYKAGIGAYFDVTYAARA